MQDNKINNNQNELEDDEGTITFFDDEEDNDDVAKDDEPVEENPHEEEKQLEENEPKEEYEFFEDKEEDEKQIEEEPAEDKLVNGDEINYDHKLFSSNSRFKFLNYDEIEALEAEQEKLTKKDQEEGIIGLEASNLEQLNELLTHKEDKEKLEFFSMYIKKNIEVKKDVPRIMQAVATSLLNDPKSMKGYEDFKEFIHNKSSKEIVQFVVDCFELITNEKQNINIDEYTKQMERKANAVYASKIVNEELNNNEKLNEKKLAVKDLVSEKLTNPKTMEEEFANLTDTIIQGKTQIASYENMQYDCESLGDVAKSIMANLNSSEIDFDANKLRDILDSKVDGVKESPKALKNFYESFGIKHDGNNIALKFTEDEMMAIKVDSNAYKPGLAIYQRLNEIHEKRPWHFFISHPKQFWAERGSLYIMKNFLQDGLKVNKNDLSAYDTEIVKANGKEKAIEVLKRPVVGDKVAEAISLFEKPKDLLPAQNDIEIITRHTKYRVANPPKDDKTDNKKVLSNEDINKIKNSTTQKDVGVSSAKTNNNEKKKTTDLNKNTK